MIEVEAVVTSITYTPKGELKVRYFVDDGDGSRRTGVATRIGTKWFCTDGSGIGGKDATSYASGIPRSVLDALGQARNEIARVEEEERERAKEIIASEMREACEDTFNRIDSHYRLNRHRYLRALRGSPCDATKPAVLDSVRHVRRYVPSGGFVYFLMKHGAVVYVGQTIDLPGRIACHEKEKSFDDVWCVPCDTASLQRVERAYIKQFDPPLNKTHTDRAVRKGGMRSKKQLVSP